MPHYSFRFGYPQNFGFRRDLLIDVHHTLCNGISLLEVLVTLSIIGILLALTIPAQELFLNRTQDHVISSQLFHAIQLARTQAITRGKTVSLCKSSTQTTCGGTWQQGYIMHDDNQLLFAFSNIKNKGNLHWRAFPGYSTELQFLSTGASKENGTFWYCLNAKVRWAIVISQSGRARIVNPDKNGKIDAAVSC